MIIKETEELKKAVAEELLIPDPSFMKAEAILEPTPSGDNTGYSGENIG